MPTSNDEPEREPDAGTGGGGLRTERRGAVLALTLDRPERRNAVDHDLMDRVAAELRAAAEDDAVRAVLLSGTGEHFCAGADISRAGRTPERRPRTGHVHRRVDLGAHALLRILYELELPVVAAVRGHAAGFGCALALASDYVVAGSSAVFSTPFTDHGFTPDSGTSFLLPRLVGVARAKEMLLLGRKVRGEEAASWGLVNEHVDDGALDDRGSAVADEFAARATVAVGLGRSLVHRNLAATFEQALANESQAVELSVRSPDFKEGMAAFAERRPPRYEGT